MRILLLVFFMAATDRSPLYASEKCDELPAGAIKVTGSGPSSYETENSGYLFSIDGREEKFEGEIDKETIKRRFLRCSTGIAKCLSSNGLKGKNGKLQISFEMEPGQAYVMPEKLNITMTGPFSDNLKKCLREEWSTLDFPETGSYSTGKFALAFKGKISKSSKAGSQDKVSAKKQCLKSGGEWGSWSKYEAVQKIERCQYKAKDSGQPCRDGKECSTGLCEYDRKNKAGYCTPYRGGHGCHIWMHDGKLEELCKD